METYSVASFLAAPAVPVRVMAHEVQSGDLVVESGDPGKTSGIIYLVLSNTEIHSVIAGIPIRLISWTHFQVGHKPVTYEVRVGPNTPFELLSRHHD